MAESPDKTEPVDERDDLAALVYTRLRSLAHQLMTREGSGQTLQATALVHEAYLRLSREDPSRWQDRKHFYLLAAQAMRRILIDRARHRGRLKRGDAWTRQPLDEVMIAAPPKNLDLVNLDEALQRLSLKEPRAGRLVVLRFFGGLTIEEAAEMLEISVSTCRRDWLYAKAWLRREMDRSEKSQGETDPSAKDQGDTDQGEAAPSEKKP